MSVIKVGAIQNQSGVEVYTSKSWCNWNGRTTPPSIYASGNISSLTDYTTGQVALNFSNALTDTNYATAGTLIYDTDKNFHSEIKWKPNRTLAFAGITDKTWHSYKVEPKKIRISVNTFLVDDLA